MAENEPHLSVVRSARVVGKLYNALVEERALCLLCSKFGYEFFDSFWGLWITHTNPVGQLCTIDQPVAETDPLKKIILAELAPATSVVKMGP